MTLYLCEVVLNTDISMSVTVVSGTHALLSFQFFIDPAKLLPLQRFLPGNQQRGGGRGTLISKTYFLFLILSLIGIGIIHCVQLVVGGRGGRGGGRGTSLFPYFIPFRINLSHCKCINSFRFSWWWPRRRSRWLPWSWRGWSRARWWWISRRPRRRLQRASMKLFLHRSLPPHLYTNNVFALNSHCVVRFEFALCSRDHALSLVMTFRKGLLQPISFCLKNVTSSQQ